MKEKNTTPEQSEVKGISEVLNTVQSEVVTSQLGILEKKILKNAQIDAVTTEMLPNSVEAIRNFEAFEWEVVRLMAYLQKNTAQNISDLGVLFTTTTVESLPIDLQKTFLKAKEIFATGNASPVYQKIFADWQYVVNTYIVPHGDTLLKAYGKPSFLNNLVPDTLKSFNSVSGALLGGGLYVLWNVAGKLFGTKKEAFSLKSMLGYVLGGTLLGTIPAGKNVFSSYTSTKETLTKHVDDPNKMDVQVFNNDTDRSNQKIEVNNKAHPEALGKVGKSLSSLSQQESIQAAEIIFGTGPATKLLVQLDMVYKGNGSLIRREIALGKHEGNLKFGRRNKDPRSGSNIGTFQIGGAGTTFADTEKKYNSCLEAGASLYKKYFNQSIDTSSLSWAQKDLMCHLGYINAQRGGEKTFKKLASNTLSDAQLIYLMSTTIQGGINAIGHDVVQMTRNNAINVNLA